MALSIFDGLRVLLRETMSDAKKFMKLGAYAQQDAKKWFNLNKLHVSP
jgi:hypothetical protein